MPKFIPLKSNLCESPVFFIDMDAPLSDLHDCAVQRCKAARDLMQSVACLSSDSSNDRDMSAFTTAAWLLLQDGCDALDAIGWKTVFRVLNRTLANIIYLMR